MKKMITFLLLTAISLSASADNVVYGAEGSMKCEHLPPQGVSKETQGANEGY